MTGALGPERIAQLADLRVAIVPTAGTWGVWDLHTREWLSVEHGSERDAWQALIQTESAHPWELRIAAADAEGAPVLTAEGAHAEECFTCFGEGTVTCPDCDGDGVVPS